MRPFLLSLGCLALLSLAVVPARAAECGDVKPEAAPEAYALVLSDTVQILNEEGLLLGFDQGDINHPVVFGSLWNGKDSTPPERLPSWWLPEVGDEVLVLFAMGQDDADEDDERELRRQYQTISNASKARHGIAEVLTGVRDIAGAEDASLDLAKELNAQIECLEALSNIMKQKHDQAKNIIGNIRG